MSLRRFMMLAVLSALAGGLVGLWAPRAEAVTATVTYQINPGPEPSPPTNAILTCGWHTGGCPTIGTQALDWDNGNDTNSDGLYSVYFRGWTYTSHSSTPVPTGAAWSMQDNIPNSCTRTKLAIFHKPTNQWVADTYYTHTWSNGTGFQFNGSSGWVFTRWPIGITVAADNPNCPYVPYSLHQADYFAMWVHSTGYPTAAQCGPCIRYYNADHPYGWVFKKTVVKTW